MGKYTATPRIRGETIVWDPAITSGQTDSSGNRISVKKVGEQGFATKEEAAAWAEQRYPPVTASGEEASESTETAEESSPARSGTQRSARKTQKKS